MIFSYPNSTDINYDLTNHLLQTDETISNISINLFNNNFKIENNIFGYIYCGIKILSIPEKITIKSSSTGNIINQNVLLTENETFLISISLKNQSPIEEYIIEYTIISNNPIYSNFNNYISEIDNTYGDANEENNYNSEEYIGKTSFFKIVKKNFLSENCQNEEYLLCYQDDNYNNNICISCKMNI